MLCSLAFVACGLVALPLAADDLPERNAAKSATAVSPRAMREHVEFLASPELEGRGTPLGKQKAAQYLRDQFERIGLEPLFPEKNWYQDIPGPRPSDGGEPAIVGRNIGAKLTGSDPVLRDEVIIVSAHYDHLGIRGGKVYPGADDNAGSVAMLLEVARRFAQAPHRPRRTLVFLSCDLEEQLLWGARWFVAHPPWPLERVKLFVTSELIGRNLGDLPLETVFVLGSEHVAGLTDLVTSIPTPKNLKAAHLGVDLIGVRSDYGPFWNEKIPFLFFSGGEHRDYHQPTDTADRLDYDRTAAIANLIYEVCRQISAADDPPAWTDEPARDLGEVRTLHRIAQLLLEKDDAAQAAGRGRLSNLQRFSVSNLHTKTKQIIERGELREDERGWLIRSSQLVLLTVF